MAFSFTIMAANVKHRLREPFYGALGPFDSIGICFKS